MPDLYDQLEELKALKAERQKELAALEGFVSTTNGLFKDSLDIFKQAMTGVDIINQSTVNADGTIRFPAGVDMSWFTKLMAGELRSGLSGGKKKKSDKIDIKWSEINGMGESYPTVYVNGKIDRERTQNLRWAITKMGWSNLKELAPELLAELLGVNDLKTLLDDEASFSKQTLSFFSLLLTYFPAKKAYNLYKAMAAAKMLEKGGDTLLDLAKISKSFALTEKEAKALSEMWDAERLAGKYDEFGKISAEYRGITTANKVTKVVEIKNGRFTDQTINDLVNLASQNKKANSTTLGSWTKDMNSYEQVAHGKGSAYYDLGSEGWNAAENALRKAGLTDDFQIRQEMWRINEKYLDYRIKVGNTFEFTSNPSKLPYDSYGYLEVQYLIRNGYTIVDNNGVWRMIK